MKKTLILALSAVAALASSAVAEVTVYDPIDFKYADTAIFSPTELSSTTTVTETIASSGATISYNPTTGTFTSSTGVLSFEQMTGEDSNQEQGTTNFAMGIKLDELKADYSSIATDSYTTLVTFTYTSGGTLYMNVDNTGTVYLGYNDTMKYEAVGSVNVNALTSVLVFQPGSIFDGNGENKAIPTFRVYDEDGNGLFTQSGLAARGNGDLSSITVNTDYIWAAGINMTGLLNDAGIKSFAAAIPEPTTATLSLLALAGLAARRRRK